MNNDQEFYNVVDLIILFLYRKEFTKDGEIRAKNRIMYYLTKICKNQDTFNECIDLINEHHILERK